MAESREEGSRTSTIELCPSLDSSKMVKIMLSLSLKSQFKKKALFAMDWLGKNIYALD